MCVHIDHDDSAETSSKKRMVTRKSTENWIFQYGKEFHMMQWLDFLIQGDRKHVGKVGCKVCCELRKQLISL